MDFKEDRAFEKLITTVRQLPDDKLIKLKAIIKAKPSKNKKGVSLAALKSLLLGGPVMNDLQFEMFVANRKRFEGWQKK